MSGRRSKHVRSCTIDPSQAVRHVINRARRAGRSEPTRDRHGARHLRRSGTVLLRGHHPVSVSATDREHATQIAATCLHLNTRAKAVSARMGHNMAHQLL